jgi:hypothetical protein
MSTENNKGIKYPNQYDILQKIRKVTDDTKKSTIKSIIDSFLTMVKTKHT